MSVNSPDAAYRGTPEGRYDQAGKPEKEIDTPQARLGQKLTALCASVSKNATHINIEKFSELAREAQRIGELDFFWATFGEINNHLASVVFTELKSKSKLSTENHDSLRWIELGRRKAESLSN